MYFLLLSGSGHMMNDTPKASNEVVFDRVSKSFGQNTPLRDISFTVPKGEALCILGRSGTGKSVTLKLMIGLLKADRGKVLVDGEDIGTLDEDGLSRIRRKMGFLFQSAALFDSFSLGDNLALPLHRLDKTKSKDEIRTIVDQALDEVGLKKDKHKLPVELSGGMRKRAGLARALVLKPEILLVDEPSSGLDRITSSEIDELLMKVKTERHTTMVIVTHDIRGARRIGDHFAILDRGDLAGFGRASELEKSDNKLVREFISEA
jgi:phospholipid/cholesterol/gamma-HCH transport system ATP-binding protein